MSTRPRGPAASGRRSSRARVGPDGVRRSLLWRHRRGLFVVGLLTVAILTGVVFVLVRVPLPDDDPPLLQTSFLCASDVTSGCDAANSIAQLSGGVDRTTVDASQIPSVLVDAVLAAEDRTFFEHGGVDPAGIVRALWTNLRAGGISQGGSTITQQYVKNVYLTSERSFTRKVREAALAVRIERDIPKSEILTRYLNTIYLGRGTYGVEAASRAYFGHGVDRVNLAQAAFLAGIIRSPESMDPRLPENDPRAAVSRQRVATRRAKVLDAMVATGAITHDDAEAAKQAGWDDVLPRSTRTSYGNVVHGEWGTAYFVDHVRHWLTANGFTDAQIYGGGLRVYTTLDLADQRAAAEAVTGTLDRPGDPAAAVVSIDEIGAVRAMIGGFDFDGSGPYSKVNLAVGTEGGGAGRQAGSAFKVFTLTEAVAQGISIHEQFDAPARIVIPRADGGRDWSVGNYADAGLGRLDLLAATMQSSNTAFAQLVLRVGPRNVADLATRMGITAPLSAVPSLTLGTSEVSVVDMASAYSTLARGGEYVAPTVVTRVTDAKGAVLYESRPARRRVVAPDVAARVGYVLHQVVEGGTGTGSRIGVPSAGKTGTTENNRDAWFVGYTCRLTTAVWVGYPDGTFMRNVHGISVTGGSFPATIWRRYMTVATKGERACPFDLPPEASTTTTGPSSTTSSTSSSTTSTSTTSSTTSTSSTSTTTTTRPTATN